MLIHVTQTDTHLIEQITLSIRVKIRYAHTSLFEILKSSWENKEISAREAARQLGVNHRTFLSWIRKGQWREK
ncbi:MAG: hypothetical protein FWE57_07320 [Chitinispirillia bacterium]|nr:hypothetical protein [Chitinispirillia bacterium]